MYKYEKNKKLNTGHAYMLFVTSVALVSLVGNAVQEYSFSATEQKDKAYIEELEADYTSVSNQLKIITDEYNDLYQSGQ